MSRVSDTVTICKNHMEWKDDALLIYFAHEKTDQTQSKPGDPRHIYANPFQPEICPILSLGIFFLIVDITKSADQPIFSGTNQYCRFHKSLKSSFADIMSLSCSSGAYGTHSIRKGAATFVCSGSTTCPSFAAVSLRAGWSMGGVTSAYIHYHGAGDQHVGRTIIHIQSSVKKKSTLCLLTKSLEQFLFSIIPLPGNKYDSVHHNHSLRFFLHTKKKRFKVTYKTNLFRSSTPALKKRQIRLLHSSLPHMKQPTHQGTASSCTGLKPSSQNSCC